LSLLRGTEGSNPSSSSAESVANLTFYAASPLHSASTNDDGSWRLFLIDSIIAIGSDGMMNAAAEARRRAANRQAGFDEPLQTVRISLWSKARWMRPLSPAVAWGRHPPGDGTGRNRRPPRVEGWLV